MEKQKRNRPHSEPSFDYKLEQKKRKASSETILTIPKGWKPPTCSKEDGVAPLQAESAFATIFPKYRESYMLELQPLLSQELSKYGVVCELDVIEGSISVKTTRKTYDPAIILKARDLLKLIARNMPYEKALRVLDDQCGADIIKISGMVGQKERFMKRRQRLIGPNGATLKALQLLTDCDVVVQGNTVVAVGPYYGLKDVRQCVEGTMNNNHPIYFIKTLMIKKELSKDDKLKMENWDKFLPKYKSKTISKRKQPFKKKEKTQYTPFPPPQPLSKIDKQLETGEYFLQEKQIKKKDKMDKLENQVKAKIKRNEKRNKLFIPPKEVPIPLLQGIKDMSVDVKSLKEKVKKSKKKIGTPTL